MREYLVLSGAVCQLVISAFKVSKAADNVVTLSAAVVTGGPTYSRNRDGVVSI